MKSIRERISIRLGLYQRRFVNDPISSVPEFANRVSWAEQSRYGNHSSNAHGERKAWSELVSEYGIVAESCGPYAWGGHKFIVQTYNPR